MATYLLQRTIYSVVLLVAVSIIGYLIIDLPPGDYLSFHVQQLTRQGAQVDERQIEGLKTRYGLDQPLYVRYWKWVSNFVQGDFGSSFQRGKPVSELVGERITMTLVLTISSLLLTWLLAIPIGVYSATHQYSLADYALTFFGMIGLAIPSFLLALIAMFIAVYVFHESVGGLFSPEYSTAPWSWARAWDLLKHLWIPALITGLSETAGLIRIMRGNLLDILGEQFVMTARAKGLKEVVVVWKHAVRVAVNPLISTLGMSLPALLGGGALISIVLNLPTVGPLYLESLQSQDMYLAGFFLMFFAIFLIIGNLLADLALAWVDPRIRYD